MKIQVLLALVLFSAVMHPAKGSENTECVGWATCATVTSAGDYPLTGGGDGSMIVLRSDGTDQREALLEAVKNYDVIVLDGRGGDFQLSSMVSFQSLSGRTLVGINGARLTTRFTVTDEIRRMLDDLNVKSLSSNPSDNLGGTLSNGAYVNEQCELTIRQALIDRYGDPKEPYRYAGVFSFENCSNIIVRNLDFVGPGSLDVGGADLLTINASNHVWVDHCRFTDGLDGNLDIVANSDFVTVSDTHFRYTEKAYNHPLSNLTSGNEKTDGTPQTNNISWIRCYWDEGCMGRMPFTSLGIHHLLNCYWDCPRGTCIDAHNLSRVLIEKSYFTDRVGKALAVRDSNVKFEWRGSILQGKNAPASTAVIQVPYAYEAADVTTVAELVKSNAGPSADFVYERPLSVAPSAVDLGHLYSGCRAEVRLSVSAFGSNVPGAVTLTAPEGLLLSTGADGDYSSSVTIEAVDGNLLQADVYLRAVFSQGGEQKMSLSVTAAGVTFEVPVTADVVGLEGTPSAATISWTLDEGKNSPAEAVTTVAGAFSHATMSTGQKVYIHSTANIGGQGAFALFNPTEAIGKSVDGDCSIAFDIETAPGYIFVPETLRFKASRVGTDMCSIDIDCSRDGAAPIKLLAACQPPRSSNSPSFSEIELPLWKAGVGDGLHITLSLYNMLANKQLALRDVVIEGEVYAAGAALPGVIADETVDADIRYYDLQGRPVIHPRPGQICLMLSTAGHPRLVIIRE